MPKLLSAKVGVPLQGNGKFDGGAYYVVGRLLKLTVLSAIINNYLVFGQSQNNVKAAAGISETISPHSTTKILNPTTISLSVTKKFYFFEIQLCFH